MPITLQITLSDDQLTLLAEEIAKNISAPRREPYTVKEAAKALNVSTSTISIRVKAGVILAIPHMGRVLIPAHEIDRLQQGKGRKFVLKPDFDPKA